MLKGLFVSVFAVVLLPAQSSPESPIPADPEIRKILAERIDKEHQSVGIVVGVIEPKGRRLVSYGSLDKGDQRPLNWRHDIRDWFGNQGIHVAAAGRYGRARRSGAGGSCSQIPACERQSAAARRPRNHPSGSCNPHLRAAAAAGEFDA